MTAQSKPHTEFSFYLGIVRNPEHEKQLVELAHWLDQNKFCCTFSVVEGRANFDVCPHNPDDWKDRELFSKNGFVLYASEHIIYNLSRALGERDDA